MFCVTTKLYADNSLEVQGDERVLEEDYSGLDQSRSVFTMP